MATQKRERLEKLNVYFSDVDLQTIFKASAARGQRPADFVAQAALRMLAELGLVSEERKRFLEID